MKPKIGEILYAPSKDLDILGKDHIVMSENDSMVVRFIDDIINERFESVVSKGVKFIIY